MKTKSLFISTIAMVVMLIVALSVGTFAWYTAQETVTADDAVVGTATSTESAIAIGWAAGASSSSVSFGAKNDLRPMIPTSAPTSGASLPSFQEAHLELQGTDRIIKNVVSATPWSQVAASGDPAASTTLFVGNLSDTQDVNVYPVVTIPEHLYGDNPETTEITETDWVGDLNHLLRVAIWVEGGEGESAYMHLGTWGSETFSSAYAVDMNAVDMNDDPYYLGNNENLVKVNDNKITLTAGGSRVAENTTFQLPAGEEKQIYIRAWIEGTALTSGLSGLSASFDVTFSVDNAQP